MLLIKIASIEEINNSRESWNHLASSMKLPSVFLTWEWITTWIKHFGKRYNLLIIFIYKESELKAIAPLAQISLRFRNKLLNAKVITLCGSLELYPDHLDIICGENDSDIYAKMVLDYFFYTYKKWDVMYLPYLADGGDLDNSLKSLQLKYRITRSDNIIAPYLKTDKSFESILSGMDRKKRYNLTREIKLLLDNNISMLKVNNDLELESGLKELFLLHKARAGNKNISSDFYKDEIISFHKEISRIFLELGWLRLYLLKKLDDNKAVSAAYGFVYGQRFNYYQTGLDPDWQRFSPGKILISKILEDLHNSDTKEFDFLGGNDSYKTYWTKNYKMMSTFSIYNRTIMGQIEYLANNVLSRLRSKRLPILGRFWGKVTKVCILAFQLMSFNTRQRENEE
jgi:hypothetical protein